MSGCMLIGGGLTRRTLCAVGALVCATLLFVPSAVHAQDATATAGDPDASGTSETSESWLITIEAPGAVPLSEPQRTLFGFGALPAVGLFRALNDRVLLGARLRGGVLLDGDSPADTSLADPDAAGLVTLGLGVRWRPIVPSPSSSSGAERGVGLWLEAGVAGALTGTRTRMAADVGIGWGFAVGGASIGPMARLVYVHQGADALDDRSATLGLIGVELTLLGRRRQVAARPTIAIARPPVEVAEPEPPEPVDTDGDGIFDDVDKCKTDPEDFDGWKDDDGCPEIDNDRDGFADQDDQCPNEAEVMNGIDDSDGCPDKGLIVLVNDRVILEERVLFDVKRARVKRAARKVLRAIVVMWNQHPEWDHMVIEGHADVRGPDDYNMWLSDLRATRARDALIKQGFDPAKVTSVGLGETRPRDLGTTEEAYKRNRRVEFIIIEKRKETRGVRTDKASQSAGAQDAPDSGDRAEKPDVGTENLANPPKGDSSKQPEPPGGTP